MGTFAYSDSYYGLRAFDLTTGVVADAAASVSASSGFTASGEKAKAGSASISAAATVTASGESIVIERSDKLQYGAGAYGYNVYDQADLQTITIAQSSTVVSNGIRVRDASAAVSASSSASSASEKIYQGRAASFGQATTSAEGFYTIKGAATISVQSAVTISYIRRRKSSAASSVTSATLTIGREKWEIITNNANTWTTIAA